MASQAPIYVKNNTNTSALTVSGLNLIAQGTTNVTASGIIGFGGSLQCMSDGYNWYVQQLVTGTFPVAPNAPTGVTITTPGSGEVTSLTVTWAAPAGGNTTSYVVKTYLNGVQVGTVTTPSPATSVSVPATSGSYTIITTSNYTATVQAFNYYVIGGTGTSGAYNWSQPIAVSINTPASGAAVTTLTANWAPSAAGIIDNYQVNIYQNGAIVGFNNNVSNTATSIAITATTAPYVIESVNAISANVIEYRNSISGVAGISPSYLWGVPTNVYTNPGTNPNYVFNNPTVTWTTQQYKVGSINYTATLYSGGIDGSDQFIGDPVGTATGTNVNTFTINYSPTEPPSGNDSYFYFSLQSTDTTTGLSTTVSSNMGIWAYT